MKKEKIIEEFRKLHKFEDEGGLLSRERDEIGYNQEKLETFWLSKLDQQREEIKEIVESKLNELVAYAVNGECGGRSVEDVWEELEAELAELLK